MADPTPRTCLVVPCFDEARRLDPTAFSDAVIRWPWLRLLFVDDGSQDGTLAVLREIQAGAPAGRVSVLALPVNLGKGEAVRAGLRAAILAGQVDLVGFWDADLSAPLDALPLLVAALQHDPRREVAMGARVKLLGTRIERRPDRHYGGRIIATLISLALGLPVYDTQCGAKLLRVAPLLDGILQEPFASRWLFDVELLARWLLAHDEGAWSTGLCELPLPAWSHRAGSKLGLRDALRAPLEVLRIRRRYPGLAASGRH